MQEAVIGVTRAKLLRDGGLSEERFSALNLDRNFVPRTLEEMRKLDPEMFDDALGEGRTVARRDSGVGEPDSASKADDLKNLLQSDAANGILLQKDAVAEIQKKVDGGWADDAAWTYRAHPDEKAEARDLAEALREFEETIRGADKEIGVILDKEGRFVAAHGLGKSGGKIDTADLPGNIVTHNHPRGTLALSKADTGIVLRDGAQEIRAVPRGKGDSFVSLSRGNNPDADGLWEEVQDEYTQRPYAIGSVWLEKQASEKGFVFRKVEK